MNCFACGKDNADDAFCCASCGAILHRYGELFSGKQDYLRRWKARDLYLLEDQKEKELLDEWAETHNNLEEILYHYVVTLKNKTKAEYWYDKLEELADTRYDLQAKVLNEKMQQERMEEKAEDSNPPIFARYYPEFEQKYQEKLLKGFEEGEPKAALAVCTCLWDDGYPWCEGKDKNGILHACAEMGLGDAWYYLGKLEDQKEYYEKAAECDNGLMRELCKRMTKKG